MSHPSKLHLALSLITTGATFYGGALLASTYADPSLTTEERTERENYIPANLPSVLKESNLSPDTVDRSPPMQRPHRQGESSSHFANH